MQTRNSIKIVFVVTGIIATIVIVRLFFVLMFNYYKEGTATTVHTFLHDAAKLSDEYYSSSQGILILPTWQSFPADFEAAISSPPTRQEPFIKGSLKTPVLHSPSAFYYTNRIF